MKQVSPIQERLGASCTGALSETVLLTELLADAKSDPLSEVTSEFPLCTSSTSRFVLAIELTNRKRLCDVGVELLCLNLE